MKSRSDCFVFHTVKIQAISSARFQSVLFFNLPLKVKVILICFWNVERFIHPPLNRVLPKMRCQENGSDHLEFSSISALLVKAEGLVVLVLNVLSM